MVGLAGRQPSRCTWQQAEWRKTALFNMCAAWSYIIKYRVHIVLRHRVSIRVSIEHVLAVEVHHLAQKP
jgi:hypothetical protein